MERPHSQSHVTPCPHHPVRGNVLYSIAETVEIGLLGELRRRSGSRGELGLRKREPDEDKSSPALQQQRRELGAPRGWLLSPSGLCTPRVSAARLSISPHLPNRGWVSGSLPLALEGVVAPIAEPLAIAGAKVVPVAAGVKPGVSMAVARAVEAPIATMEPAVAIAVPGAVEAVVAIQAAVAIAVPEAVEAAVAVEAPVAPVAAGAPAVVAPVAVEAPVVAGGVAVILRLALEESHLWEMEVKP